MTSALQQEQAFKLRYLAAALIAALASMPWACGTARAEPGFSFDATPGKLPKTVIPVHYAIELTPICRAHAGRHRKRRHRGARAHRGVTLNAVNMALASAGVDDDAQRAEVSLDAATETATLSFAQPLAAGAHRLRIAFTAKINTFGRGLFYTRLPDRAVPGG